LTIVSDKNERLRKCIAYAKAVYEWLKVGYDKQEKEAAIAPDITDESCVIVALLHDLGKVGMPGNPQYIRNEPSEKQKMYGYKPDYPYRFNSELVYLSVPVRSIYLALQYISLTEEEVQAIVYHDGQYIEDNRSCATHEKPLTLLLQYADSWSGFVIEK